MEVQIVDLSPGEKKLKKGPFLPKLLVAFFAFTLMANVAIFSFLIGRNISQTTSTEDNNISMQIKTPQALGSTSNKEDQNLNFSLTITPTPSSPERLAVINSEPETDGYWTSAGFGSSEEEILVGRNNDYVSRGFVTYDLSSLPNNIKVKEAKLRLFVNKKEGQPDRYLGELVADHLIYGDSLDKNDYGSAAILSTFTEFNVHSDDWWEANVTSAVINDLYMSRIKSQYRIHFTKEIRDNTADFLHFNSAKDPPASVNTPELVIVYHQ